MANQYNRYYFDNNKNKRRRKRKNRFVLYLIILIISCLIASFVLYALVTAIIEKKEGMSSEISSSSSDVSTSSDQSSSPETSSEQETSSNIVDMTTNPVPEAEKRPLTYLDDAAFIGDSIMTGLANYQIIDESRVLASVGMNIEKINTAKVDTAGGSKTILQASKELQANKFYIMLGSNGIAWLSNEKMIASYSDFIDSLKQAHPNAQICVLSIPPVTAAKETAAKSPISNSDIDVYNQELLKMANNKGVRFIDLNAALKGPDGKFPAESAEGDGMHFKRTTYDKMLDCLLTHPVS